EADERARAGAGELERARNEAFAAARDLGQLQDRVTDIGRQLAERAQAARDLSTENEQLKGRVRDAEGLRAEYVRLRTSVTEAEFLKSEVARLEQELRTMRVDALGAVGTQRARPARGTGRPLDPANLTIGESLASVLERFADGGTRSIAIADTLGFPLASNGNDGVALAAYAALLFESAARADQFMPVAQPAAIEVVDHQGARISVWAFPVDSERLLLANLSVTPVDSRRVDATLGDLASILAPTPIASGGRG
ncbi:MAG: hypothetical protein H0X17_23835, partial [Deltaproteobacteria bacterium]|nr:hypothetical protein [Deltaproteobacteria bacterium]